VTVFSVSGRITLGDPATQLGQKIRQALEGGRRQLVVNLADVVYIDSAGMGTLVDATMAARKSGGQLKLASIPRKVRDLLEATNLFRVLEVHPDEAAALASFSET
jgi:anti-sigma B factor antagonist